MANEVTNETNKTNAIDINDLSIWFYTRAELAPGEVIEITEENFDYALGCVPPFYRKDENNQKIFGVGEMYSYDVTFWFTGEINGRYFGLLSNLQTAQNKLANIKF